MDTENTEVALIFFIVVAFLFFILLSALIWYLCSIANPRNRSDKNLPKQHTEPFSFTYFQETEKRFRNSRGVNASKWLHYKPGVKYKPDLPPEPETKKKELKEIEEIEEIKEMRESETEYYKHEYFRAKLNSPKIISILIPLYNEEPKQLIETLHSIHKMIGQVTSEPVPTFSILLVQDGWGDNVPVIMKQYLRKLFDVPKAFDELWDENRAKESSTYIFERMKKNNNMAPTKITYKSESFKLNITLIIKRNIRTKYNSFEWFLSEVGYCGTYDPVYTFTTNCSTTFAPNCMSILVQQMDAKKNCVVATGKQLVKPRSNSSFLLNMASWVWRKCKCQKKKKKKSAGQKDGESLFDKFLRAVQSYDQEVSFAFLGGFAQFEFLPIVPAGCGLYRWAQLKGRALNKYFEMINKPVHECGIVENNLKIGGDRMLTYFAVLYATENLKMTLCPNAEFFTNAETDFKKYIQQMRQWTNGSVAGLVYTLQKGLILSSELPIYKKLIIFGLFLGEFAVYLALLLSPAAFLSSLRLVLAKFVQDSILSFYLIVIYTAYYLFFQFIHIQHEFLGYTFVIQFLLGALTILSATGYSIYFLITNWNTPNHLFGIIMILLWMFYNIVPVAISLITQIFSRWKDYLSLSDDVRRFESITINLFNAFCRFLALPMLFTWCIIYDVSRISDFSWGINNRGPVAFHDQFQTQLSNIERREVEAFHREAETRREENQEKLKRNGTTFGVCVALTNILVLAVNEFLYTLQDEGDVPYYFNPGLFLLWVLLLLSVPTLILLVLSFSYYVYNYSIEQSLISAISKLIKIFTRTSKFSNTIIYNNDKFQSESDKDFMTEIEQNILSPTPSESIDTQNSNSRGQESLFDMHSRTSMLAENYPEGVSHFIASNRKKIVWVITLLNFFYFTTNLSTQMLYMPTYKATAQLDQNLRNGIVDTPIACPKEAPCLEEQFWTQEFLISGPFEVCGFFSILIVGLLGDLLKGRVPGIYVFLTGFGVCISVVANVVLSSLLQIDSQSGSSFDVNFCFSRILFTTPVNLSYLRILLVVLGNDISATAALMSLLSISISMDLILQFIGTRLLFGALGNMLAPLLFLFIFYFAPNPNLLFYFELGSTCLLFVGFISYCLAMFLARNFPNKKVVVTSFNVPQIPVLSKHLAIVFLLLFFLSACYYPIKYDLLALISKITCASDFTNTLDAALRTNHLINVLHSYASAVIGLAYIIFLKFHLKPVTVFVTFFSLLQIPFCFSHHFVSHEVFAFFLITICAVYRTYFVVFAQIFFAYIIKNQIYFKYLGFLLGLFNCSIYLGLMAGNIVGALVDYVHFTRSYVHDFYPTLTSFGAIAVVFAIPACFLSLKLPRYPTDIADDTLPAYFSTA